VACDSADAFAASAFAPVGHPMESNLVWVQTGVTMLPRKLRQFFFDIFGKNSMTKKLPRRPDEVVQVANLRKSLCNCPDRSTIKKCSLAIKNRNFPYLHYFFEIFLLRSVDLAVLVHFHHV
jgi:hypothetical protein